MDVILDIEGGNSIPIEISPMESVREIKERVQASLHVPFSHQNLFFNGQLLQDCVSIQETQIKHGSRIKLVVSTDAAADLPPPPPLDPDYEYAMWPEFPNDEYIPFPLMQYHYDSFGMPEFSPDTQLRPMPPHLSMLGYTDDGSTSTKLDVSTDAATNLPPPLMQETPPPPQQEPPPPLPRRVTLNVKMLTGSNQFV